MDEALPKINHLDSVRERFLIRAELLPADLAFVGLYNELREAAFLAVELCRLHAQSAAFPLARRVFEATQQIIVLATEEDYLGVGARAWLYHLRKERRVAHFAGARWPRRTGLSRRCARFSASGSHTTPRRRRFSAMEIPNWMCF